MAGNALRPCPTLGLHPNDFRSIGVANLSSGDTVPAGSIIAVLVPEPSTAALLAWGW